MNFQTPAKGIYVLEDPRELDAFIGDRFFTVTADNRGDYNMAVCVAFWEESDAPLAEEADCVVMMGVLPGLPVRLSLDLKLLDGNILFPERTPGKLKSFIKGKPIDLDRLARVAVFTTLSHSLKPETEGVELTDFSLEDEEPEYPLPEGVWVDELGQWSRKSWPGKSESIESLGSRLREELTQAGDPAFSPELSRYGGFREMSFEATGFFRSHHDGKCWWLVDPEGYAFYSLGVDCIREGVTGRVDGIESLFAWLPDRSDKTFEDCWGKTPAGRDVFDFSQANLIRLFGDDWWESWAKLVKKRLLEWGFNTIGNWSSPRFIDWAGLPYVWNMDGFPSTEAMVFRDFPDVFSPEYSRGADRFARQLESRRDDPCLIGYFMRNEPQWAFVPDLIIAESLLENPEPLESKKRFIAWLEEKYKGNFNTFRKSWRLEGADSFPELMKPIKRARRLSKEAENDLREFSALMIEAYNTIPAKACRRVDANHMNLGLRWAWVGDPALYRGAEWLQVFSLNCYDTHPFNKITAPAENTGLPVMIGEFHHGGLDRGLPANGIIGVRTQQERARAYTHFTEMAASHGSCVGTHYFQWNDQPVLGRFDGENFQIGLVDICSVPYDDYVGGVAETNRKMLEVLTGRRPPRNRGEKEFTVGF